ncbi:KH domain-containing protein [Candidatus Gracilibacteria bacterium]|nr:KH domain-containing protein [Candidatus Gracilibacteria bacterium]
METIIQTTLKLLLDKYGAEYDCVTISEENNLYRANIESTIPARIIGKNGDTLAAIQILLKNILFTQSKKNLFVSVDVDNYRKQHEDRIIEKAQKFIDIMKNENLAEIKLPPMSPYYRRIIHLWIVNNFPELSSDSIGEGTARAIRLFYK